MGDSSLMHFDGNDSGVIYRWYLCSLPLVFNLVVVANFRQKRTYRCLYQQKNYSTNWIERNNGASANHLVGRGRLVEHAESQKLPLRSSSTGTNTQKDKKGQIERVQARILIVSLADMQSFVILLHWLVPTCHHDLLRFRRESSFQQPLGACRRFGSQLATLLVVHITKLVLPDEPRMKD